jgi:hypothetical protein
MANVKALDLATRAWPSGPHGGGPEFSKVTNPASGGIAQNDYFYLAMVPAGTEIVSFERFHEAGGAGATMSYGYLPVNSTLGPTAADTYWFSASDVSAAGRAASTAHPIKFDYPVFIVAKNASATAFAASKYVGAAFTARFRGASV